ncbi:MAG: hypothetical protein PUG54_11690, partial [Firmicutes bacterium]|nr:hypothetical protein [Bacillota bacterium]
HEEYCVYDDLTGVLQTFNLTREEARERLRAGEGEELFTEAYLQGYIGIAVNNQYADCQQETGDGSFYSNPTISNFKEVFDSVISEEELLDIFEGEKVNLSFNIARSKKYILPDEKKTVDSIAKQNSYEVGDYFDVMFLKSVQGKSSLITELGTECEIVLQLPEELKGSDRQYAIVHVHENSDGTIEKRVLKDLDNNPDTITFRTNKFSAFAIVYPKEMNLVKIVLKVGIAVLGVIILFTVIHQIVKSISGKKKRKRR